MKKSFKIAFALTTTATLIGSTTAISCFAVNKNNFNFINNDDKQVRIQDFTIKPKDHIKNKKTAYGWTINDITNENFDNIPQSGRGKIVRITNVRNYPEEARVEVEIQTIQKDNDSFGIVENTRVYNIEGFKKESLEDKVERLYGNIKITPTEDAAMIPAIPENWKIDDINDTNFKNLPKSEISNYEDRIDVKLVSLNFDNSDPLQGKMILTYSFSWFDGVYTINKDFVVSGFEKYQLSSNIAAQNHYRLVALFRMIDVKQNINKSTINTDEFEEGGIEKVREVFNLPDENDEVSKFNVITLLDVKSSKDNTLDTYNKGKNMKLDSVQFKFSIFDWVNNKRTVVETEVFSGFENPLKYWNDLFKNVSLKSLITDDLFSFQDFYNIRAAYSGTTQDHNTGKNVLNGTSYKKQGYDEFKAYSAPLADWLGYIKYTPSSGIATGLSGLQMKDFQPNQDRFVNMITKDAKDNYIGSGPNKNNDLATPIQKGGVSEILRDFIFHNIKNQELYKYDWIVFKNVVRPSNTEGTLSWEGDGANDSFLGCPLVYVNITFEYDIWLNYEKQTIKFNLKLGMADTAKSRGNDHNWGRK